MKYLTLTAAMILALAGCSKGSSDSSSGSQPPPDPPVVEPPIIDPPPELDLQPIVGYSSDGYYRGIEMIDVLNELINKIGMPVSMSVNTSYNRWNRHHPISDTTIRIVTDGSPLIRAIENSQIVLHDSTTYDELAEESYMELRGNDIYVFWIVDYESSIPNNKYDRCYIFNIYDTTWEYWRGAHMAYYRKNDTNDPLIIINPDDTYEDYEDYPSNKPSSNN